MTKEAKHLSDERIDEILEPIVNKMVPAGMIVGPYKEIAAYNLVDIGPQAKAYNTVKAEREWKEFSPEDRGTFPKEEGYYSCSPDQTIYSSPVPIKGLHWSNHKPGRFSSLHWKDEDITHYRGPITPPTIRGIGDE